MLTILAIFLFACDSKTDKPEDPEPDRPAIVEGMWDGFYLKTDYEYGTATRTRCTILVFNGTNKVHLYQYIYDSSAGGHITDSCGDYEWEFHESGYYRNRAWEDELLPEDHPEYLPFPDWKVVSWDDVDTVSLAKFHNNDTYSFDKLGSYTEIPYLYTTHECISAWLD